MTPSLTDRLQKLPLLKHWRARRGLSFYLSEQGAGHHWGHFRSFAEAQAWLPASAGFDTEWFSDEYLSVRTRTVYGFDYPAMIWLDHAFRRGARSIWDIGGSVGSQFYAYQRFLDYPADLRWRVCERPVSAARGREYARSMGASALSFGEDLAGADAQSDIWLAAGTIEFIEGGLNKLFDGTGFRPRHLILNKLPLSDRPSFVSTQNIGKGCYVVHDVYNRQGFLSELEARGYQLIDSWKIRERDFRVPGQPEASFDHYTGLYLRRADDRAIGG